MNVCYSRTSRLGRRYRKEKTLILTRYVFNITHSSLHYLYIQLLNALNEVADFCLRSILTSIFKWRDMQVCTAVPFSLSVNCFSLSCRSSNAVATHQCPQGKMNNIHVLRQYC